MPWRQVLPLRQTQLHAPRLRRPLQAHRQRLQLHPGQLSAKAGARARPKGEGVRVGARARGRARARIRRGEAERAEAGGVGELRGAIAGGVLVQGDEPAGGPLRFGGGGGARGIAASKCVIQRGG